MVYLLKFFMERNKIIYWDNFKNKIVKLYKSDCSSIQVISDFDWTLTYIKNKKTNETIPWIISILYNKWYLSEEYSKKAKDLENIYILIEKDEEIPLEIRKEKMLEWRQKHEELLINSWLKKDHIDSVINSNIIQLRNWCDKFFQLLNDVHIPIIILSASGLGTYAISSFLWKANIYFDNIYTISNEFIRDESWNAISRKTPLITSLNKDETIISKERYPEIYEKTNNRKTVILLWNSIWDIDMSKDEDNDLVLRIWFIQGDNQSKLQVFKQKFDITLVGDWWMKEIIDILEKIESKNIWEKIN